VIEIEFVGAAQTVTGSKHIVRSREATVVLDYGLFQGPRRQAIDENRRPAIDPGSVDAVVLSHAHIDHSGALPLFVKSGFAGAVYSTPATRDLCAVMLRDAALIQAADARYINKVIERDGANMRPVEPLYTEADVIRALDQFVSVPYHRKQRIAPGITLTFVDAGHVLGSAITILDIEDEGMTKRLVFSGDLGRKNTPILRDPEVPTGAELLLLESTYGDRLHPPYAEMETELARVLGRTIGRGGKVVIPSFALERAQEIVYALKRLRDAGKLPKVPVYVDSPLTVQVTEIFKLHPDCYDQEMREILRRSGSPFEFPELKYVSDKKESQAIDASDDPAIIISASGMCEGGRVVHHLKATIGDSKNMIIIVGFQAQHTLGRRLVERRRQVPIFGVERSLEAEVAVLNGFSAHADRNELVEFAEAMRERGPLRQVALVHGEIKAQLALRDELEERHFPTVRVPARGERMTL
jgi:metallo-beta-lactamase family protein